VLKFCAPFAEDIAGLFRVQVEYALVLDLDVKVFEIREITEQVLQALRLTAQKQSLASDPQS